MLYAVRMLEPNVFRMVKFDRWLNVEAIYILRRNSLMHQFNCECFQGNKSQCRHRQMIYDFIAKDRVDKGWFYNWDTKRWEAPIGSPIRAFTKLMEKRR